MAAMSLAAQAASSVMQYQGQKAQADYTNKANDIAKKEYADQQAERHAEELRSQQEAYESSQSEANAYQDQAMKERASLDALLGEYGGGVSADRRLASLGIREGQDLATLKSNATKQQQAIGMGSRADQHSLAVQAASLRPAERPSALGAGLTIASAALNYGQRMNTINNPKPGSGS
jgi:predicted flap endonuclease-1-like 5' DNA nuclease